MEEVKRRKDDTIIEELNEKVDCLQDQLTSLEQRLDPVIEIWNSLTGLVKVLKWVGLVAKWIGIVGGAILAILTLFTYKKGGG